MLTGQLCDSVQVDCAPLPALRHDAGETRAKLEGPLAVRQQHAELRCNTGAGFFLKAALSQYSFREGASCGEIGKPRRGQWIFELAFQNGFPGVGQAVVETRRWRDERLARPVLDNAPGL